MHLDTATSAYLDDTLPAAERATVETHLATCQSCRSDLEALRSVRRLVAALPQRRPRRSLVPRRAVPAWLSPTRWLSTVAAAVFALIFVVSSLPAGMSGGAAQPAFRNIGNNLLSGEEREKQLPGQAPAAIAAPSPTPLRGPADQYAPASPPSPAQDRSTAKSAESAAPQRASPQPRGEESGTANIRSVALEPQRLPSWLWLIPAAFFGAIALTLQWRIARRR